MTVRFLPFEPHHLSLISLQPAQQSLGPSLDRAYGAAVAGDMTWSCFDGDRAIACAGVLPIWGARAHGWAVFAGDIGPAAFLKIHRRVLSVLEDAHRHGFRRIETTVDPDFDNACRWVGTLGFQLEGYMSHYTPDGRDHLLVARVQ